MAIELAREAEACSRCGAAFRCGALAGDARCWCAALPELPAERLKGGIGCLCAACLAEEIESMRRSE